MDAAGLKAKKNARLEDIARQAGVSISTVSRALNDSPAVKRRTKQEIWRIAREHDYEFRRHMPNGPVGADATIAVIVPAPQARETRVADPFFLELLASQRPRVTGRSISSSAMSSRVRQKTSNSR